MNILKNIWEWVLSFVLLPVTFVAILFAFVAVMCLYLAAGIALIMSYFYEFLVPWVAAEESDRRDGIKDNLKHIMTGSS